MDVLGRSLEARRSGFSLFLLAFSLDTSYHFGKDGARKVGDDVRQQPSSIKLGSGAWMIILGVLTMPKKDKETRPTGGRISPDDRGPRDRVSRLLKWVAGVTAILSLIFAVHQAVQLISDVREQRRQITELYKVGKVQQGAADYEGAWASFERALKIAESGGKLAKLTGQLSKETITLREAQEDLAMEWVKNIVRPEGQTFSRIVDQLVAVLNRGAANATGVRKADLLAHVGWANFLRWRDGNRQLNPEQQYRQALEIDPANPFAHAHWGHWMAWGRETSLEEAKRHFSAALASGRAREYVRKIQLAAFQNLGMDGEGNFLGVINEMRTSNEKIDPLTRNRMFAIYAYSCRYGDERFQRLLAAVPATEQLATFRALFYDVGFDEGRRWTRDACLATLTEAAGDREEALRLWVALRQHYSSPGSGQRDADAAIKRLSPHR